MKQLGHPIGADLSSHFNRTRDAGSKWIGLTNTRGSPIASRQRGITAPGQTARVKTYGEILREYEFHPESKSADVGGKPCGKQTVGLLQRRHVGIEQIKCIGKESNSLEVVESGLIHSEQNVYTEYPDPRRDEWETKIRPALRKISLSVLQEKSGLSRVMLINARTSRARLHRKNQELIAEIVRKLGAI